MPANHDWTTDPRPLSECLKDWHSGHGWTRQEASDRLGIPLTTYHGWIANRARGQEAHIRRLMSIVDTEVLLEPGGRFSDISNRYDFLIAEATNSLKSKFTTDELLVIGEANLSWRTKGIPVGGLFGGLVANVEDFLDQEDANVGKKSLLKKLRLMNIVEQLAIIEAMERGSAKFVKEFCQRSGR